MTFGAHKLVHSEPFSVDLYELWHLLSCDLRKKFYRCTSIFPALNYCSGIFFQILQLSIRSGAHKLFRRFLDFSQFLTAVSRNLWRHLATKMRIMYCLWMADPFWKIWKPHQNRPINCHTILVRTMSLSNEQRCGLGAWQTKTVTNTIFSHLQPVKRIKSNLKR